MERKNTLISCTSCNIVATESKIDSKQEDGHGSRLKCLTAILLQQGYRYHKLRKAFSKFYHRHSYDLITKFNVGLKTLLRDGLFEQAFL